MLGLKKPKGHWRQPREPWNGAERRPKPLGRQRRKAHTKEVAAQMRNFNKKEHRAEARLAVKSRRLARNKTALERKVAAIEKSKLHGRLTRADVRALKPEKKHNGRVISVVRGTGKRSTKKWKRHVVRPLFRV